MKLASLVNDSIDIRLCANYTEAQQAAVEEASATGGQPFPAILFRQGTRAFASTALPMGVSRAPTTPHPASYHRTTHLGMIPTGKANDRCGASAVAVATAPSGTPDYHVEPTRPTDLAWRGDTPAGARRSSNPRMSERLDDEELADWRAGRDAGVSARPR
jgi:hypothetical protein